MIFLRISEKPTHIRFPTKMKALNIMIVVKPKSQKDIPRLIIVLTNVPKFGHVLNKKLG